MPKEIPLVVYPYGPKYDPNAFCAFHASYIGHPSEDGSLFKTRVQELIDQNVLSFYEEGPHVRTNMLPNHNGQAVNAIINEKCIK